MKSLLKIVKNSKPHFYNGKKSQYIGEHVDILVAIGVDETATITMSLEAYKTLTKGGAE
jgi:hypothetical protein